jgi:DNA-binding XRE family transcriptional regulator
MTDKQKAVFLMERLSDKEVLTVLRLAEDEAMKRGIIFQAYRQWAKAHSFFRKQRKERNGRNEELIAWRKGIGADQKEAGQLLGVHRTTYSGYETGALNTPQRVMDYIRKDGADGTLQGT